MYVDRELGRAFDKISRKEGIVAVVGPRQSGKTTFLREKLRSAGGRYVTLDDPDARALFDADIKAFERQYLQDENVLGIDEVQYGEDSGRKLKYLVGNGRRIWVTSSSQLLLGHETLSWLVGRVSILKLNPFSLGEFSMARGQKEITDGIRRRLVHEQMVYGSYPRVVLEEDTEVKIMLLRDLGETMVLKDMVRAFSLRDIRTLERLVRYLSLSIGNRLKYEQVSSDLGLSFQALKKYLDAMEKSYLISLVQPYFTNRLKELVKQPKVYFIDTGIRNSIANSFPVSPENQGRLFENYVFTEMVKAGKEVKYWHTKAGAEVDFVVEKGEDMMPVEAKVTSSGKVERSLKAFIDAHRPRVGIVVSYAGSGGSTTYGGCRVEFTDVQGLMRLIA